MARRIPDPPPDDLQRLFEQVAAQLRKELAERAARGEPPLKLDSPYRRPRPAQWRRIRIG